MAGQGVHRLEGGLDEVRAWRDGACALEGLLRCGAEWKLPVHRVEGVLARAWHLGRVDSFAAERGHPELREWALELPRELEVLLGVLHQRVRSPSEALGAAHRRAGCFALRDRGVGGAVALGERGCAAEVGRLFDSALGGDCGAAWRAGASSWAALRPVDAPCLPSRVSLSACLGGGAGVDEAGVQLLLRQPCAWGGGVESGGR
mmetsp:Transcript_114015/g.317181  ORF Transcript_114015/g.317181 Transcript_114015/m.317181 type:complete len:204 (-) Transcript_114015:281-892(-)